VRTEPPYQWGTLAAGPPLHLIRAPTLALAIVVDPVTVMGPEATVVLEPQPARVKLTTASNAAAHEVRRLLVKAPPRLHPQHGAAGTGGEAGLDEQRQHERVRHLLAVEAFDCEALGTAPLDEADERRERRT
jgi:hypothetical protein